MPLMGWLVEFLENVDIDQWLKMLLWSGQWLTQSLHAARGEGELLSQNLADSAITVGYFHITLFLELHQSYKTWGEFKLFNPRPKLHAMCHLLDSCATRRNPVSSSCWMEEDWIRSTAALAKKPMPAQRKSLC